MIDLPEAFAILAAAVVVAGSAFLLVLRGITPEGRRRHRHNLRKSKAKRRPKIDILKKEPEPGAASGQPTPE
jgi:hypothetical protein